MNENQIKANAINGFVSAMIGALESGFVDKNNPTLAEIHRVAHHHVSDNYGIKLPNIIEQWGDETANDCGFGGGETKDRNLTVEIIDDELIVSVGVSVLQHAIEIGRAYGNGEIKITNESQFLEGLVRYLSSEKEDGSTLIHHAFDTAVTEMLENGELGVDELEDA